MRTTQSDDSARFVRSFLLVSALLFGSFAALNRTVDPYGAYGGCPSECFLAYRSEAGSRIAKAELADRFEGTTAIIGSSRAEVGYNPESDAIPDGTACNLGLSGTNFLELAHVAEHVLRQPNIRRIMLCFDFQQFDETESVNFDFETSRFNPQLSLFDYHCNLLFGSETTEASLDTLSLYFRDEDANVSPLGHRSAAAMERLRDFSFVSRKLLRNVLEEREDLAAIRGSQKRLKLLKRVVKAAQAAGVELIVVIHPVHATTLEAYYCAGLWPTHESWVADVVRIVQKASGGKTVVWDFTGFNRYSSEPLLSVSEGAETNRWFWEASHCKADLGEQILRRVFEHPAADRQFGRRLTLDNLESHLAQLRREHSAWRVAHHEEAAAVRELALEYGCHADTAMASVPSDETTR